jgi:phage tail sheath protein FI
MAEFKNTPGVYVTESSPLPSSVVGVATGVPVFIGFTQTALMDETVLPTPFTQKARAGKTSVLLTPTLIDSLAEYETIFGTLPANATFLLYDSLKLFFTNGGGACYIVSVGDYQSAVNAAGVPLFDVATLQKGLDAAGAQKGPAITVIPDAVLLPPDADFTGTGRIPTSFAYQTLVQAMLAQCGALQDRVALFDLYGADAINTETKATLEAGLAQCVEHFQVAVGDANLSYGIAYFPSLITPPETPTGPSGLVPPSGAMAGIFAANDALRGVWNAPANIALKGVAGPRVAINSEEQGPLNVPLNGKSVNVIREFTDRGAVVWGARTLDGNSPDYRYVQIRRTLIYIEQSIQTALDQYVFAANDGQTWVAVTAMVSSFLQNLWSQGGLMGDKASDAFTVQCGLGSTMTGQDILDGYMIVQVTLQMVRPAEFIELTFKQKMEGVA